MSVGRLQAALGAVTNEFTAAAANINFDFTLIKVEAPKEFQPLGESLPLVKKTEAESGSAHVLARELGALFTGICPKTPQLLKAYGTRVSEIAEASKTRFGNQSLGSIFSEYSGIDGTAIWAAATSSEAALQAHFLGCMISRIFEPSEAVAIWVELVRARKNEVADKVECGEQVPFALANVASRRDITKTELAEWDARIRAWMSTADEIKKDEALKLRDLLKTVQYPVNSNTDVYQSVIEAWKSALDSMEKLIRGEPLSIEDGAILLGLSSWHIYPNLKIFSSQIEVNMDDSLIHPGGVLSLGLSPSKTNSRGVYWCLSLAHLRHYGKPVRIEQKLQDDPTRITFPDFMFAALGALLGRWRVQFDETAPAIELLHHVCHSISREPEATEYFPWAATIKNAAKVYLEANGCTRDSANKLLQLGRRRFSSFIGDADITTGKLQRSEKRCFGLLEYSHLLSCLKDHEARIRVLRYLMAKCRETELDNCMIRYRVDRGATLKRKRSPSLESSNTRKPSFAFITPPQVPDRMDPEMESIELSRHAEMEDSLVDTDPQHDRINKYPRKGVRSTKSMSPYDELLQSLSDVESHAEFTDFHYATVGPSWGPICEAMTCPSLLRTMTQQRLSSMNHRWAPRKVLDAESNASEQSHAYDTSIIRSTPALIGIFCPPKHPQRISEKGPAYWLLPIVGDIDIAAVFCNDESGQSVPDIDFADISWCFDQGLICSRRLIDYFDEPGSNDVINMLSSLDYAHGIYKNLPDARISVQSLEHKFADLEWFPRLSPTSRFRPTSIRRSMPWNSYTNPLRTPRALSLVAFLDSGRCNLRVDDLADIMAVSSGDSIYVPRRIVCDPSERPTPYHLERILGNVGKAGLTLLMPPQAPMIREIDYRRLMSLQQTIFDGKNEDCFRKTSVHLSFTDHHVPLFDDHTRKGLDSQVCILESVISIRDSGEWVADVDILKALRSQKLFWNTKRKCNHTTSAMAYRSAPSIEGWDDVIDFSNDRFVVRAHGNWLARLATTSVLIQLFEERNVGKVTVCDSNTCWKCCLEESTIPHALIL